MIKKSFYKSVCEVVQNEPHYQPQIYLINTEKKKKRGRLIPLTSYPAMVNHILADIVTCITLFHTENQSYKPLFYRSSIILNSLIAVLLKFGQLPHYTNHTGDKEKVIQDNEGCDRRTT